MYYLHLLIPIFIMVIIIYTTRGSELFIRSIIIIFTILITGYYFIYHSWTYDIRGDLSASASYDNDCTSKHQIRIVFQNISGLPLRNISFNLSGHESGRDGPLFQYFYEYKEGIGGFGSVERCWELTRSGWIDKGAVEKMEDLRWVVRVTAVH